MSVGFELATQENSGVALSALIAGAGERAAWRFVEFFTVNIRNPNTRAAYGRAAGGFLSWCEARGIARLQDVQPVHVAAYIEQLQGDRSAPTVKQHLACIRMLFDWRVTGQVVPSNPAHAVRGPRHSVSKGSTPVLSSLILNREGVSLVYMAKGILTKRALDILNRVSEIKSEIDFSNKVLPKEMRYFMEWLGDHLRFELQREDWEQPKVVNTDNILYLYSPTWQLRGKEYVAFCFGWSNLFEDPFDPPCVELYLQAENLFPPRNELLNRLRPKLKRSGFTDYYEGEADPSFPIWKNIRIEEFHTESGFDLDSFVVAVVDGFRRLIEIEPLIEDAFRSLPEKPLPLPSERGLKTIAFLDTECEGARSARRMTELAIVNVAYDAEGDAVVGVLEEYCMNAGQTLDETRARGALGRADFIVAHNSTADKPLLARYLPGTEKMKWLCSLRGGIEWKELLGIQSESLETLMGKAGLRYEQDHSARADASDLKRLLAQRHKGRTYLGRLLDSTKMEA